MDQEAWEEAITASMLSHGWEKDRDDETTFGFSYKESEEFHWIRDYDKKSRKFVQYNGNQKIILKSFRTEILGN